MKKITFAAALMLSMMCSAAFSYGWSQEGKLTLKNGNVYIHSPYDTHDHPNTVFFRLLDFEKATPEFRQCLEDGKFGGFVRVRAEESHGDKKEGMRILVIDKKAICKRIDKYNVDARTVTGKLKVNKNSLEFVADKSGDVYEIPEGQFEYAPQEFRNCIDDGKYKGRVEITAELGPSTRTSESFHLNSLATCTRK